MTNPFVFASALARMKPIKCPHCGARKLVERKPKVFRVCPRCHRHFPDPMTKAKKR